MPTPKIPWYKWVAIGLVFPFGFSAVILLTRGRSVLGLLFLMPAAMLYSVTADEIRRIQRHVRGEQ